MSSMKFSTFPTVATVIGLSKEVVESGPLLATLAVDPNIIATPPPAPVTVEPLEIQAGDPVTQAVVDNIIGKHPTKKEPVKFKCEICNVSCWTEEILNIHYNGAKHARKVKGQELVKEISRSSDSTFVITGSQVNGSTTEFTCKICNVRVNSYQQLQQHLSSSKHKNKAESNTLNTTQVSVPNGANGGKGEVSVDIGPNRLYCAACNVHVNSDIQLHQHITSSKHANKVNGRRAPAKNNRGTPYTRPKAIQGSVGNYNDWKNKSSIALPQKEWHNWQQTTPANNFVPGGMLYDKQ